MSTSVLSAPVAALARAGLAHPRVVEVAARPRHEAGPVLFADFTATRVALLAHHSERARVSLSVQTLVEQLVAGGYWVLMASTSAVEGPLAWPRGLPPMTTVYRRPNLGYDFGSWAALLDLHPRVAAAPAVLLLNDSMVGPFVPLAELLERFEEPHTGVFGLTDTTQDGYHLQSYWIGYRGAVLAQPEVRRFWHGIRLQPTKRKLIKRYEIGQSKLLLRRHHELQALFPYQMVVRPEHNPTSYGWRRLLMFGFPFIKREIVLNPPEDVRDGGDVAAVVHEMFGENVLDWV